MLMLAGKEAVAQQVLVDKLFLVDLTEAADLGHIIGP